MFWQNWGENQAGEKILLLKEKVLPDPEPWIAMGISYMRVSYAVVTGLWSPMAAS